MSGSQGATLNRPETKRLAAGLNLIVSHPGAHVDEHVAAALLRLANPEAKVAYLHDAEIARLPRHLKVALVGTGGGTFDEHRPGGRLPGECAATLVAKHFGLDELPEHSVLLTEVLRADTERGQNSLEWGEVVKTLQRYGDPEVVNDAWIGRFIAAVVNAHLAERKGEESRPLTSALVVNDGQTLGSEGKIKPLVGTICVPAFAGFETLAKLWLVRRFGSRRWNTDGQIPEVKLVGFQNEVDDLAERHDVIYVGFEGGQFPLSMSAKEAANFFGVSRKRDESGYQRIRALLKELERYADPDRTQNPFEMGHLVRLLNEDSDLPAAVIETIVRRTLDAYEARAVEFAELCPKNFKETGKIVEINGLKVAFVKSELASMQSYCRTQLGADVIVVRKGNGGVAIFTNSKTKTAVVPIAEVIFRAEAKLHGLKAMQVEMSLMALRAIGYTEQGNDLPAPAGHWYLFVEGGQLLNGSLSHTDVPPSLLSDGQIKAAVEEGLQSFRS